MKRNDHTAMGKLTMILLSSVLGCVACSPTHNQYFPVTDLKERNNTLGFSITPPSGSGWYEKLNDRTLYYLKKLPSTDYAIYTTATEIHLAEKQLKADSLLKLVERSKRVAAPAEGLKNISLRVVLEPQPSPLCVRYRQAYEDHGGKDLASDQHIKIEKNGVVCLHPATPGVGIDMCYVESERSTASEKTQSYREEGEFFLSSLRFFPGDG